MSMFKWLDEEWRSFLLWVMIKHSVVGYTYIWVIIVHHLMKMEVRCLWSITNVEMKWNAQANGILICRTFLFTGKRLSREVLDHI